MSAVRCIRVHPKLGARKLTRIGFDGIYLYLKADRRSHNKVQIWRVNTLLPDDWECVFEKQLSELNYSIVGYSYEEKCLYILIVATFPGEENLRVVLIRNGKNPQEWDLHADSGADFWRIPLEDGILGATKGRLHLYDRSMVQGPVPFWYLNLGEDSFTVARKDLIDSDRVPCTRFAICLDGDKRKFARLRDDNDIAVYDDSSDRWIAYSQSSHSDFDLHELAAVKGLRETYGRSGRRVGSVESSLTIHSDGGICVAKRVDYECHRFYQILFDDEKRQYSLKQRGAACLEGVSQMCYVLVSERMAAVVGLARLKIAPLQPPPLSHLAFWTLQKHMGKVDEDGAWTGGVSEEKIRQAIGFPYSRPLVQ